MASVVQFVALVGLIVGVVLLWGVEWAVLLGSGGLLAVGVAMERPSRRAGDG